MRKNVLVIWNDPYHTAEENSGMVNAVFSGDWNLKTTYSMRDLFKVEPAPDLAVILSVGRADGESDMGIDEQKRVKDQIEAGMGALFIHAGMACIQDGTPLFEAALGRFASHPKGQQPVRVCALPGVAHPILEGFVPFENDDEPYFCHVDIDSAQPFLCGQSAAGTEIAGWTQSLGKGRVCSLTPGHNADILGKMVPLIGKCAEWCVKEI